MVYDVEKLAHSSLKVIILVLDDINLKAELRKRQRFLLYQPGKLRGIAKEDHETIIINLIDDKVIKETYWVSALSKFYLLHIGETFFDFCAKAKLQLLKKDTASIKSISRDLRFDKERSCLYFNGYQIAVSSRHEKTNGHYILQYIFDSEEGLIQEYSYWEIAEDLFEDNYSEQDAWRKYHKACEYTNEKIRKITGIDDFFIYSTGRKGTVKINKKYLK
jgi:hypothetical protein